MIGSLISISSARWIGIWIGLEINLLSFIPLITSAKNAINNEAALKYFITQAIASTILLFSIIYISSSIYLITNFNIIMVFNSRILIKMGAAPFHFWFPEIIEGLYWNNCLILLTWQKLAPIIIIIYNKIIIFFSLIILTSIIIRGILGINQTNIRKILAYSSINHIGWIIASIIYFNNIWIIYFITYLIITINIIYLFKIFNILNIKQLLIKINNNIILKLFFIINFFSLGGLPPFLGFIPKWLTIQILIENNIIIVTFIITIITLITLYFYIQVTFSTLIINNNENNFYLQIKNKNYYIIFINTITLIRLIIITLIFNLN